MICESCGEEMVVFEDHSNMRNTNSYDTPPYFDGYIVWACNNPDCNNTETQTENL